MSKKILAVSLLLVAGLIEAQEQVQFKYKMPQNMPGVALVELNTNGTASTSVTVEFTSVCSGQAETKIVKELYLDTGKTFSGNVENVRCTGELLSSSASVIAVK